LRLALTLKYRGGANAIEFVAPLIPDGGFSLMSWPKDFHLQSARRIFHALGKKIVISIGLHLMICMCGKRSPKSRCFEAKDANVDVILLAVTVRTDFRFC
jgi:hypothetical protein